MTAVRLALRIIGHCRARSALFALVGLAACAGLSAMVIAGNVKSHEYERRAALVVAGATIRGEATYQRHDGATVTLVTLAARGGSRDVPPGVVAGIDPGEVVMSPALADLVANDPDVARWFPYEDAGRIAREGLTSAGELNAYVVEREPTLLTSPVQDLGSGELSSLEQYQRVGFLLFCAAPALRLIVVGSRVGRARRAERRQALRLLGSSPRQVRACLALEVSIPASLGAAVAQVLLALIATRDRLRLPLVDRWMFGHDTRVNSLQVLLLVAAIGAAAAVAGVTVGTSDAHPRSSIVTRWRRRWMVPVAGIYAAGLALAAWSWALAQPKDLRRVVAIVAITVGLPAAAATVASIVARVALRRTLRVLPFLAAKRLTRDPRVATRFAAMAGVVVFVLSVAQPLSRSLAFDDDPWELIGQGDDSIVADIETFEPNARFVPDSRPPGSVRHFAPIVELAPVDSTRPRRHLTRAVIATCEDLGQLVVLRSTCADRPTRLVADLDGRSRLRAGTAYRLADAADTTAAAFEIPTARLRHGERQQPLNADLVLPPSHPLAVTALDRGDVVAAMFTTPADGAAWTEAHAWVVRTSPLFSPQEQFTGAIVDGTPGWVMLGTIVAVAFAAIGALITVVDDRTRRARPSALRTLGVTAREALQIQILEAVVGAISIAVLAGTASIVVANAFLAVDEPSVGRLTAITTITLSGATAVVAVAAISSVLAERPRGSRAQRR